jgi:hypothetical protein
MTAEEIKALITQALDEEKSREAIIEKAKI